MFYLQFKKACILLVLIITLNCQSQLRCAEPLLTVTSQSNQIGIVALIVIAAVSYLYNFETIRALSITEDNLLNKDQKASQAILRLSEERTGLAKVVDPLVLYNSRTEKSAITDDMEHNNFLKSMVYTSLVSNTCAVTLCVSRNLLDAQNIRLNNLVQVAAIYFFIMAQILNIMTFYLSS